jgi:hypothetical protein
MCVCVCGGGVVVRNWNWYSSSLPLVLDFIRFAFAGWFSNFSSCEHCLDFNNCTLSKFESFLLPSSLCLTLISLLPTTSLVIARHPTISLRFPNFTLVLSISLCHSYHLSAKFFIFEIKANFSDFSVVLRSKHISNLRIWINQTWRRLSKKIANSLTKINFTLHSKVF